MEISYYNGYLCSADLKILGSTFLLETHIDVIVHKYT